MIICGSSFWLYDLANDMARVALGRQPAMIFCNPATLRFLDRAAGRGPMVARKPAIAVVPRNRRERRASLSGKGAGA